jgi:predicted nuclease of predicted toxin-antitoxin system
LRFLVDAQLPPALARWIRAQGQDADHVADVGLLDAPDTSVWDLAIRQGYAVITKDRDFAE